MGVTDMLYHAPAGPEALAASDLVLSALDVHAGQQRYLFLHFPCSQ